MGERTVSKRRRRRRGGPSVVAEHRLAEAIRRNRAELENEVTEGLLRSELYRHTGRPDVAADVIEEQRSKIAAFEGRVRDAIAAAAVEAEAEAVLGRAAGASHLHERHEPDPSRVPQLMATAIAAVAVLAVVVSLDGATGADGLQAAVRIDSSDGVAAPSDAPSRVRPIDPRGFDYLHALHRPTPNGAVTVDDPATRRWLSEQAALLDALGMNVRVRVEVMRDLQGLVASLEPGTLLPDAVWLEVLAHAAERATSGADDGAADDVPGRGEDGAEPASRPASGEESGSGDGRWIPASQDTGGEQTPSGQDGEEQEASSATDEAPGGTEPPEDDDGGSSSSGDGDEDADRDGSRSGGLLSGVSEDDGG